MLTHEDFELEFFATSEIPLVREFTRTIYVLLTMRATSP